MPTCTVLEHLANWYKGRELDDAYSVMPFQFHEELASLEAVAAVCTRLKCFIDNGVVLWVGIPHGLQPEPRFTSSTPTFLMDLYWLKTHGWRDADSALSCPPYLEFEKITTS